MEININISENIVNQPILDDDKLTKEELGMLIRKIIKEY